MMITQKLLDHDEPVRVRVRGEDDEEPPEPDQLRRVRRERRVAAAHVEARDEHGPICVACLPRRHGITYSLGTLDAIDAGASRTPGPHGRGSKRARTAAHATSSAPMYRL